MGHKRPLNGSAAEKDEKIGFLEDCIQGYVGRLSVLQSRLLATVDTLDVIQNHHAQERREFLRAQATIQARLDEYINVVREAQLERDDMRDAVLRLVEKVETSNDYSSWPHSQMQLSSLAGPASVAQGRTMQRLEEEEVISHASALIATLRCERDNERKTHAQTREIAEGRILALEAKLSRREAELESLVANKDHGDAARNTITSRPRPHARFLEFKTDPESDQIIAMLDDTVTRNKVLEREMTTLYARLENARSAASENPSDAPVPKRTTELEDSSQEEQPSLSTPDIASPVPSDRGDQGPSTSAFHERLVHEEDSGAYKDLDQRITLLSEKIDSFADERKVLLETISLNKPIESADTPSNANLETRLRILENECLGLKASENALRDELESIREDTNARENELLDAINSLRLALAPNTLTLIPDPNTLYPQNHPPVDLLDDGEISMELATPLLPLATMSPASSVGSNQHVVFTSPSPSSPRPILDGSQGDPNSPLPSPSLPFPASSQDVHEHEPDDIEADPDAESDDDNSPTLSHIVIPMVRAEGSMNLDFYRATTSFVAELRQMDSEMVGKQAQHNASEPVLDGVGDSANDLHPP